MNTPKEGWGTGCIVAEAAGILGIELSSAYIRIREGWLLAVWRGQRLVMLHQAIEAVLASAMATSRQFGQGHEDV